MKYNNWNEMSDAQKYEVFKKEADLETHNATTKDDLVNIVKWLWNRFDYEETCADDNSKFDKEGENV